MKSFFKKIILLSFLLVGTTNIDFCEQPFIEDEGSLFRKPNQDTQQPQLSLATRLLNATAGAVGGGILPFATCFLIHRDVTQCRTESYSGVATGVASSILSNTPGESFDRAFLMSIALTVHIAITENDSQKRQQEWIIISEQKRKLQNARTRHEDEQPGLPFSNEARNN